jgi:hypothetical protein
VTILLFHEYRCAVSDCVLNNCPETNEIDLPPLERSSADFWDFLLNFVLAGSAFSPVPCAKRDEIDDRMTAIVWVSFPGFIVVLLGQRKKGRYASFFMFRSRGRGCASVEANLDAP